MRKILFIIIIALLSLTGAWAQEATYTVNNLKYKVVQPAIGERYAILSGYKNSPEGILDIPGLIRVRETTGFIAVPVTMIGEQAFSGCSALTYRSDYPCQRNQCWFLCVLWVFFTYASNHR